MKIAAIPKTNYDIKNHDEVRSNTPYSIPDNKPTGDSVAFGSSGNKAVGFLQNLVSKTFEKIEKGGFFVTFLIVDTISMIVPRILVGLNRDKDKLGHLNYQAGKEEAGREVLSGPSMNLLPMGITALVNAGLLATHMGRDTLAGLTNNMTEVVKKGTTDKTTLRQQLAETIFDDSFGSFSYGKDMTKSDGVKAGLKQRFTKLLTEAESLTGADFNEHANAFEREVIAINNLKNEEIPTAEVKMIKMSTGELKENPKTKIKEPVRKPVEAKDFIKDFKDYSKDVIEKMTKQNLEGDKAAEFLKKAKNTRYNVKMATALGAFLVVGAFLKILPKIYQQGDSSPAAQSAKRAEGEAA